MSTCELCEREDVETTVHHLLPKEMGGTFGPTANLCIPCHKQIHALYTNEEIAARLTSIPQLKEDPATITLSKMDTETTCNKINEN